MGPERRVQVVLGEAERDDGLLRFVLEAEGFDLVGLASSDEELDRVLRGARPSVVVLDGGISAAAAFRRSRVRRGRRAGRRVARRRLRGAGGGAGRPEPRDRGSRRRRPQGRGSRSPCRRTDLGAGCGRAAPRSRGRHASGSLAEPRPSAAEGPTTTTTTRRAGRRMQVLVAAATWFLVITALTAIADRGAARGGHLPRRSERTAVDGDVPGANRPERPGDERGARAATGSVRGRRERQRHRERERQRQRRPSAGLPTGAGGRPDGRPRRWPSRRPGEPGERRIVREPRIERRIRRSVPRKKGPPMTTVSHGRSDEEHGRAGTSEGAEERSRSRRRERPQRPARLIGRSPRLSPRAGVTTGTTPVTVVPAPGADRTSREPSSAAKRSAMPCSPVP